MSSVEVCPEQSLSAHFSVFLVVVSLEHLSAFSLGTCFFAVFLVVGFFLVVVFFFVDVDVDVDVVVVVVVVDVELDVGVTVKLAAVLDSAVAVELLCAMARAAVKARLKQRFISECL